MLMEGIFFYQQTHEGELQQQKTQDAIKKAFQDAGITPFKDGQWKQYVETSFLAKGSPAASHVLHEVHKLQNKNAISAYLFNSGLDDQNPEDWNDHEVRMDLVVPDPSDPSSDEEGDSREGEGGGEMEGTAQAVLIIPSPVVSSSEEEEDLELDMEEEQEEKKEASRKRKKR